MKKRTITAIIMFLLLAPIVFISNPPEMFIVFQIVVCFFAIFGCLEMFRLFEKKKKIPWIAKILVIIFAVVLCLNVRNIFVFGNLQESADHDLLLELGLNNMSLILLMAGLVLGLFVFLKDLDSNDVGKLFTIILYVGFGCMSVIILRYLGVRFIVYVLLTTVTTDIFAYLVGMKFGRHKMAPNISPKKSWEGAIGGTVVAIILASSFAIFYGNIFSADGLLGDFLNPEGFTTIFDNFSSLGNESRFIQAIVIIPITILGSIAGQIGDLVASKFKREYEIKDFGTVFPGHGGVLDRFDSLLFVSLLYVAMFLTISVVFPIAG